MQYVPVVRLLALIVSLVCASPLFAAPGRDAEPDPYAQRILDQIALIRLRPEQVEPFRAQLRDYYAERNGSLSRIFRQGGDYPVRVRQDLRRCARRALETMDELLDDEQLKQAERLLELANEQYMANNQLLK